MASVRRPFYIRMLRRMKRKFWLWNQYRQSKKYADRYAKDYEQLQSFCLFIGYPRSGSSLTGALIDAHPDVVMAHELDVLKCIRYHFTVPQIYWALIEKSKFFHEVKGNQYSKYSYAVPNQWQGRYRSLRVIGDKFGDRTVEVMGKYPQAMATFEQNLTVPLKFIHVIRNPYNNISTIYRKHEHVKGTMADAIDWYFQLVDACEKLRQKHGSKNVHDVHLETLIAQPEPTLRKLLAWLDLEQDASYLKDCASIVFDRPRKTQAGVPWTPELIADVRERMQAYDFLREMNYQPE